MARKDTANRVRWDVSSRISERALRRVLESADQKFRQLDMEKPKVWGHDADTKKESLSEIKWVDATNGRRFVVHIYIYTHDI